MPHPLWLLAAVGYSMLEYYLGKTTRTKSNSTVELALQSAKIALGIALGRRRK